MSRGSAVSVVESVPEEFQGHAGAKIGTVQAIDDTGVVFVDFPGSLRGPTQASLAVHVAEELQGESAWTARRVVLIFENDDPRRPVIVGVVADTLQQARGFAVPPAELMAELVVDGRSLKISAKDELSLSCGKSQITLRKDGKLVLRGTNVISRSSGPNRLRGASVKIN